MPSGITYRNSGRLLEQEGMPTVKVSMTAVLDCGCAVHMGRRTDNKEVATGAVPCSSEHTPLIEEFQRLMKDSLVNPTALPLHLVVQGFLDDAEKAFAEK